MAAPHLGAWIARVRGPNNPAIPAFINIGQRLEGVGESEELKAFTTGGFFGSEYGPFNMPYPDGRRRRRAAAQGNDAGALREPAEDTSSELVQAKPGGRAGQRLPPAVDAALRSTTPIGCSVRKDRDAFDLTKEPKESFDKYNTGRFGLGCLLARRLTEAGRAVHRGDDRVRAVPALGHARKRPRHAMRG